MHNIRNISQISLFAITVIFNTSLAIGSEQVESSQTPCGLEGTVDERIQDCSKFEGPEQGNFILVVRTLEGLEVHKDVKSGLLWSDLLTEKMNIDDSMWACKEPSLAMAGIPANWKLPTKGEYESADTNGIKNELPRMSFRFVTRSIRYVKDTCFAATWVDVEDCANATRIEAWSFDGESGYGSFGSRYSLNSIRCIAE